MNNPELPRNHAYISEIEKDGDVWTVTVKWTRGNQIVDDFDLSVIGMESQEHLSISSGLAIVLGLTKPKLNVDDQIQPKKL